MPAARAVSPQDTVWRVSSSRRVITLSRAMCSRPGGMGCQWGPASRGVARAASVSVGRATGKLGVPANTDSGRADPDPGQPRSGSRQPSCAWQHTCKGNSCQVHNACLLAGAGGHGTLAKSLVAGELGDLLQLELESGPFELGPPAAQRRQGVGSPWPSHTPSCHLKGSREAEGAGCLGGALGRGGAMAVTPTSHASHPGRHCPRGTSAALLLPVQASSWALVCACAAGHMR